MRIEIIGNLGRDAEERTINGRTYLSFSVAPRAAGKDKDSETVWVSCLYGSTALKDWLSKGRQVFVRGDYRDKLYTKRDGTVGIDRSVMVSELELLGGRDEAQRAAQPQQQTQPAFAGAYAARQQTLWQEAPKPAAAALAGDNPDDDLPF